MSARDRPTAVITSTDYVPLLCSLAAASALRIPQDLSLISYGDSAENALYVPEVASIRIDDRALGRLAGNVIVLWLSGEHPPAVSTELAQWIERGSIGQAPSNCAPET